VSTATPSLVDVEEVRPRIDAVLTGHVAQLRTVLAASSDDADVLADAVAQILSGGKRLRAAFCYWSWRAHGGVPGTPEADAVLRVGAALELFQAAALFHDDVMDDSDTRRGFPAAHREFAQLHVRHGLTGDAERFGMSAAILLGDLTLIASEQEFAGALALQPRPRAERARVVFDLMRTEVTVGQYLDVQAQATGDSSVRRASLVARFKSGKYTIERPLLMGAALAGAGADVVAAYSGYGLPLGEAFQLRDDVLGVFGDPAVTGKPAGDDLREGKRTFLVAATLEAVDAGTAAAFEKRLGDPALDAAGVAELRATITASGALARTESRIADLTAAAVAALDAVTLDPEAAGVLRALAAAATRRTE